MSTLKIDGYDFFDFLRVAPGEGFDPADQDFREPQFSDTSVSEGQPLISLYERNREMQWPLHLNPGGRKRRNVFIADPSGESVAKFTGGADFAVTREASGTDGIASYVGGFRDKHAYDGTSTPSVTMGSRLITLPEAGTYVSSAYVWIPSSWDGGIVRLDHGSFTGATSETFAVTSDLSLRDQWQRIYSYITVVDTDLDGSIALIYTTTVPSSAPTGIIYSDAVLVEKWEGQGTPVPSPYFDGDTSLAWWEGAQYGSVSQIGGKDGLHRLLQNVNNTLKDAQVVEWQDDGASNSTFYDVQFARFEPDYNYRRAQQSWLSGILRVWTKPYGTTGTYRIAGSNGVGTTTVANGSLGMPLIYTFNTASMPAGDIAADLDIGLSASIAGFVQSSTNPLLVGVTIVPTAHIVFWRAASALSGGLGGSVVAASGAIASQSARQWFAGTLTYQPYKVAFDFVSSRMIEPNVDHHVMGLIRANVPAGAASAYVLWCRQFPNTAGSGARMGPTISFPLTGATEWHWVDFGRANVASSGGAVSLEVNLSLLNASSGSATSTLEMTGLFVVPQDSTVLTSKLHTELAYTPDGAWQLVGTNVDVNDSIRGALPLRLPVGTELYKAVAFYGGQNISMNPATTNPSGLGYSLLNFSVGVRERFTYAR